MTTKEGKLFVVSAPAGTGKTTLVSKLIEDNENIVQSLSYTTRRPRQDEQDGVHYNFINEETFAQKIKEGEFLEYVNLYGDMYGTSKKWVEERLKRGKHVFLVIDTQGAMLLMGNVAATFIFIKPPSKQELRRRLLERRTESDEVIEKRLAWAEEEMKLAPKYDYVIVNDDLEQAARELKDILIQQQEMQ